MYMVILISSSVKIYSIYYMKNDPKQSLFHSLISLFSSFMLLLIGADNILVMLIGWEGIGICS